MKKLLLLVFAALLLVGCGSDKQKTTTTVCTIDKPYIAYTSAKQTIISEGDIAKKISFEGIFVAPSKEELDEAIPLFDAGLKSINSLDGVTAKYERIDEVTIKDIAEYDLEKTSIDTLSQIGLMQTTTDSKVKVISVEQTTNLLTSNGFTCKAE